jgi:hypothetical protein
MSSLNLNNFGQRFAAVCGTAKPSQIQQLLGISYQAAKNYLCGRMPAPEMLILIQERTSCSIDWLLTGRGKPFVDTTAKQGAPPATDEMETFIRRIVVEVINERPAAELSNADRVIVLHPSELLSEKVEEVATFADLKH